MFSEDFQRYYYLNKRRSWRRIHTGYDTNDGLQQNRWTSTLHSKDKTSSSLSLLNREGRWGTTDDFATSFLHFSLFSTALWDLLNCRPVHSLMSSSHLFLCLPCLLSPFTVPCKMVLARPDERETWPYHCSLRLFTMDRSSCGPIACWIFARTNYLVGNKVFVCDV